MRFKIIFVVAICLFQFKVQAQNYEWALSIPGNVQGIEIINDAQDNIYVFGEYKGVINISGDSLKEHDTENLFIAKYTGKGDLIWVTSLGGARWVDPRVIVQDDNGDLFLAANMIGSFNLNDGNFILNNLNANGLLFHLDSSGVLLNSKTIGDNGDDFIYALHLNDSGEVEVGGAFSNKITFASNDYFPMDQKDAFIARFDKSFNELEFTYVPSMGVGFVAYLGQDRWSNNYMLMMNSDTSYYDTLVFEPMILSNDTSTQRYLTWIKTNPNGKMEWFKTIADSLSYIDIQDAWVNDDGTTLTHFLSYGDKPIYVIGDSVFDKGSSSSPTVLKLNDQSDILSTIIPRMGNKVLEDTLNQYYLLNDWFRNFYPDTAEKGGYNVQSVSIRPIHNYMHKYDAYGNKLAEFGKGMAIYGGAFTFSESKESLFLTGWIKHNVFLGGNNLDVDTNNNGFFLGKMLAPDNRIEGYVYQDQNNNGKLDSTDVVIKNRVINLNDELYHSSNDSGFYVFGIGAGSFKISTDSSLVRHYKLDTSSHTLDFSSSFIGTKRKDFRFIPIPNRVDLAVNLSMVGIPRLGNNLRCFLDYRNIGTKSVPMQLSFFFDTNVFKIDSISNGGTFAKSEVKWEIDSIAENEGGRFFIIGTVLNDLNNLDKLFTGIAEIRSDSLDFYPEDNRDSVSTTIRGSYDPNIKVVEPKGDSVLGTIPLTTDEFIYTIHFQNTGTDTAYIVTLNDPIEEGLDLESLSLISASHPYSFTVSHNRVLIWTFENIMLPDSGANLLESVGFVKYRLKPESSSIQYNFEIKNKAFIYFDQNPPIITNEVVSRYEDKPLSIKKQRINDVLVYPNPSSGELNFDISDKRVKNSWIEIIDLRGRLIDKVKIHSLDHPIRFKIDTPGIYIWKLEALNQVGKIVVR